MDRKVFYDEEDIIGYSDDIIADIRELANGEEDDVTNDLIEQLKDLDWELVVCHYHPMGAYVVRRLVEERI